MNYRVCYCLLAGAVSAGGGVVLFMSVLEGAGGAVDGRAGAAPVVVPGWLLVRGVTSRMLGGAAGFAGFAGWVWAVLLSGEVPA